MKKLLLSLLAIAAFAVSDISAHRYYRNGGCPNGNCATRCTSCKTLDHTSTADEKPICQKQVPVETCPEAHVATHTTYTCPPGYDEVA